MFSLSTSFILLNELNDPKYEKLEYKEINSKNQISENHSKDNNNKNKNIKKEDNIPENKNINKDENKNISKENKCNFLDESTRIKSILENPLLTKKASEFKIIEFKQNL